jgi:hypothetical protein
VNIYEDGNKSKMIHQLDFDEYDIVKPSMIKSGLKEFLKE